MSKFQVSVVYPLYYEVEADTKEEAKIKALEQADYYLETSSVKPVVQEITLGKKQ